MTPDRLRYCLDLLGWNAFWLARYLDLADGTPRHWLAGRTPVPHAVAAWLETLTAAHEAAPRPAGWAPRKQAPSAA